jgi:hypothetical protein
MYANYKSYPLWEEPAQPITLHLCPVCYRGWNGQGGTFSGGGVVAKKMMNNLIELTRRPWEWSLSAPFRHNGVFHLSEGTVTKSWKPPAQRKP